MARGAVPKDPEKRERRNPTIEMTEIEASARPEAPQLPGADRFSVRTLEWYATWSAAPQASRFTSTDWQRLHMIALLVEAYFASPSQQLMAEIRLNEERLGATPMDRLRLRWRITERKVEVEEDEPVLRVRRRSDPRLRVVGG